MHRHWIRAVAIDLQGAKDAHNQSPNFIELWQQEDQGGLSYQRSTSPLQHFQLQIICICNVYEGAQDGEGHSAPGVHAWIHLIVSHAPQRYPQRLQKWKKGWIGKLVVDVAVAMCINQYLAIAITKRKIWLVEFATLEICFAKFGKQWTKFPR